MPTTDYIKSISNSGDHLTENNLVILTMAISSVNVQNNSAIIKK